MKQVTRICLFLLLVATAVLAACGGDGEVSFSTANIQDAFLAKDEEGNEKTTNFAADDTFYAIVDLANAPDETEVRAAWTAVDVGSAAEPNTVLDEATLTTGSGTLTFDMSNTTPWPAGAYKVDLYLNGELETTLEFEVEGEVAQAEPTEAPTDTPAPTETAGGVVASLEDVRNAVVRIQAQGSFVDPEFGLMLNTAGQGTGFIIDEAGIAVTNNHVVTGAALLEVWIEGEDQPRNARVLGVSECADLAVIDIDGEGFPTLQWYDDDIQVGLDVYGAGFPLFGNTEYTLTRGIVSKEQANGDTGWASIDSVIEHDATINPGNSGGPLVDANGRVVGINYAGSSDTNQYFAIERDLARPLIEQMRQGENVDSIGINGEAVTDGDTFAGIWVSSVASGSPADQAGIRGGDFITTLEGLVVGTDGTMASYCDILRSRNPEDTMSVELIRFETGEILEGQINGRALEVVRTLDGGGPTTSDGGGGGYAQITDDTGTLVVSVPASWSQVDGSAWTNDGEELGLSVVAAPDLNGFRSSWTVPGVSFKASADLGVTDVELLDAIDLSSDCQYDGRESYSDQLYTGQYDIWSNCGGSSTYVVLTAVPQDSSFVILLEVQLLDDNDVAAFEEILNSFIVQ